MKMNGLVKKLKRSTICTKGKRIAGKKMLPQASGLDLNFADDSNDSGFDIESRTQKSNRNRVLLDGLDHSSSDDLDRDSSDDSIDSGIFGVSGSVNRRSDAGRIQQEDNLANLLCHSISISEKNTWNEENKEPPSKRICLSPDEEKLANDLNTQLNNSTHINLLGIASESDRPHLTATRTGSSNATSLSTNQMITNRRKITRKQPSLHITYPNRLKDGQIDLRILAQPEEQHRARYMTEGSRGAIKDRQGSAFPTVKLFGYNQPVTLQVFIGTDQGKIQPHLFYQACKVSGKNCTPCNEKVIDGTTVIEISMLPDKDMIVSCDCIGILKERNVDVEQRLPYFNMTRAKKKNTRCRMVFRVNLSLADGGVETLQVASSPILCTQPPGIPEICKKSIKECSVSGGTELFIIGKNFLKDTKLVFEEEIIDDDNVSNTIWQDVVEPEKEYLHQTHLVCRVPPYHNQNITEPLKVHLTVQSGGKTSEPHTFIYLPLKQGLAADNLVGNYMNIASTVPGTVEYGQQMQRPQMLPAIIQVPCAVSTTTIPTVLMPQATAEAKFSEEINHDTSHVKPNFPRSGRNNILQRNPGKASTNQVENGKNSDQIHVLVLQQNERNLKRNHAVASAHGGRFRFGSYPGKRLNRFGHNRGKFIAAARNKLATVLQPQQAVQQIPGMPLANESLMEEQLILKQEMLCDSNAAFATTASFPGDLMNAVEMVESGRGQNLSGTILTQSLPQTILSTVEQAADFQPQQLSPVEGNASLFENKMASICEVPDLYPTQSILQVSSMSPEMLQTTVTDSVKVAESMANQTVIQNSLVTNPGIQTMVENGNLLALQQQAPLIQQNALMQNEAAMLQNESLLAMQEATLENNLLQSQLQTARLLPECLPVKYPQLSNEVMCSTITQNEMMDNQNKMLVCIEESVTEDRVLADNPQGFARQALKCEVPPEEFGPQQHGCMNENAMPGLLGNSDLAEQLKAGPEVKIELVNTVRSPTMTESSQQENGMVPYGPEVAPSRVDQSSLLQALQCEQMLNNMPVGAITNMNAGSNVVLEQHPSSMVLDHLMQRMKQRNFMPANTAGNNILQPPNTSCISMNMNTMVSMPQVTAESVRGNPVMPTGVMDEKAVNLMNTSQNSMTNALTMLSESDLLSFINPSTFDNV